MSVEVKISANWDRWARGMGHVESDLTRKALTQWSQANEVFFDRSQANAHIVTGDLKASGSAKVNAQIGQVTATIKYGVTYAMDEENRGGSHAFITRAWEQTEVMFREALPETWDAVVRSWR